MKFTESKGHICFAEYEGNRYEYLVKGSDIYRAPISDAIMTDGNRCGRWECSAAHWERNIDMLLDGYDSTTLKKE